MRRMAQGGRHVMSKIVRRFLGILVASLAIFVLLPEAQAAQVDPLQVHNLSLQDGLSQSSVNCIFQDHKGFLWIGTQDGLNRYDGHRFTIYKPEPGNPRGLSDSHILSIYEDRANNLWIGTYGGGLNRFDRAGATVIS